MPNWKQEGEQDEETNESSSFFVRSDTFFHKHTEQQYQCGLDHSVFRMNVKPIKKSYKSHTVSLDVQIHISF